MAVGGSDVSGNFIDYSRTVKHAGLRKIYAGDDAAELIGVSMEDDRVPDVIGIAAVGTVYSTPTKIKKISEHGGYAHQDRHVPTVVWGAGARRVRIAAPVKPTQIAPTVLEALGLPAHELRAVRVEHTQTLPGLR